MKKIRDNIVKDFMTQRLEARDEPLSATSDVKLQECIKLIRSNANKSDQSAISAFYLTYNGEGLRPRQKAAPGRASFAGTQRSMRMTTELPPPRPSHPGRSKQVSLYLDSVKKILGNLPQPKNKLNYVISSDKLSRIRNKYMTILRQARRIQQYSKRQYVKFNQDWRLCERILHEVNRGQEKFDDPEVNFDFYIWQASKLCASQSKPAADPEAQQ